MEPRTSVAVITTHNKTGFDFASGHESELISVGIGFSLFGAAFWDDLSAVCVLWEAVVSHYGTPG